MGRQAGPADRKHLLRATYQEIKVTPALQAIKSATAKCILLHGSRSSKGVPETTPSIYTPAPCLPPRLLTICRIMVIPLPTWYVANSSQSTSVSRLAATSA